MPIIQPKTLDDLVTDFLNTVEGETGVPIDTRVGSVLRAMASANSMNTLYVQSLAEQVRLNSRFDTADDAAAESFVNQFSPPFTPRLAAVPASQSPLAPTALAATATTSYVWLGSVAGLSVGQQLSVVYASNTATTTISSIEPTKTLLSTATTGDTVLNIDTTGCFVGATIVVQDGAYAATGVVQSIVDATHVGVSALSSLLTHTFNPATSTTITVTLRNVVGVSAWTFSAGAVIGTFVAGSTVTAASLITGQRFYRFNPDNTTPSIPARTATQAGYKVQSKTGSVQYEVVADTLNPAYDSLSQTYKIPANASEVFVRVEAVVPGSASNVAANMLTLLPTPLPGIDGTMNPFPIQNGADQETLDALKSRFRTFIATQGSANKYAVSNAVSSVSTGLEFSLLENVASDGVTSKPGNFVVLVGDITGTLTSNTVTLVSAAVEKVRPLTSTFDIVPPTINQPVIVLHGSYDTVNYTAATVITAVQTAIYNSFLSLGAGVSWNFNDLITVAMNVPGVLDVLKLTVNGNGFDRTSGTYTLVGTGPANGTVSSLTLTRPPLTNITVS